MVRRRPPRKKLRKFQKAAAAATRHQNFGSLPFALFGCDNWNCFFFDVSCLFFSLAKRAKMALKHNLNNVFLIVNCVKKKLKILFSIEKKTFVSRNIFSRREEMLLSLLLSVNVTQHR